MNKFKRNGATDFNLFTLGGAAIVGLLNNKYVPWITKEFWYRYHNPWRKCMHQNNLVIKVGL